MAEKIRFEPIPNKFYPYVEQEAAPKLYEFIHEVAGTLGLERKPGVIIIPKLEQNIPGIKRVHGPNAFATLNGDVIFTEEMLHLLGDHDFTKPLNDVYKGIVAHEMHHCANTGSIMAWKTIPPLATALAAGTAYYLYRKATTKTEDGKEKFSPAKLEATVNAEMGKIQAERDALGVNIDEATKTKHSAMERFLTIGKYAAVVAAGYAGGMLITGAGLKRHEFAADKFASQFLSDKGAFIKAIQTTEAEAYSLIAQSEKPTLHKIMAFINEHTMMPHPSTASRATNIGVQL